MGKPDTRLVYRVAAIIWSRENHYAYDIQEFSTIDIE